MNKTKTIEAIDKLIEDYTNKTHSSYSCSLCKILDNDGYELNCENCINKVFKKSMYDVFCVERTSDYKLSYSNKNHFSNLVKFWTTVRTFLSPLEEEIEIADIKEYILILAKPYKK